MDRVNLLKTLRRQLESSVEQAANELLQPLVQEMETGPYVRVLPQSSGE